MQHRWEIKTPDPAAVERLVAAHGVTSLLACCLLNRGQSDPEVVASFLKPRLANLADPNLLPNMATGVNRLFQAREAGEALVIFGDYDVDGVTSTALLHESLGALGWSVGHYLPHRMREGYGLSIEAAKNCLHQLQPKLILAVDCGSTSTKSIAWLQGQGTEVIVLDHHQVPDPQPPAVAIINPQLAAEGEPDFRELCTAGLAFKILHAIVKAGRERGITEMEDYDIRPFLDLVALGTIADLVPLHRENRILAVSGLRQLNQTQRPGLRALIEAAGIKGAIGGYEVGFQLGPRLNAAGRLESATLALDLLRADNPDTAAELAAKLDRRNRDRQQTEREITQQVIDTLRTRFNPETDYAIVAGDPGWHIGVVGIVASRVQKEFYRPTIIFGGSPEGLRGSGRSVEGFDLVEALRECDDLLDSHGGHAMAAGVSLQLENVDSFKKRFNEVARAKLEGRGLMPTLKLDASIPLSELTFQAIGSLGQLQPTGQGIPEVTVAVAQLELNAPTRWMGKEKQHAKLSVTDGNTSMDAVFWNAANKNLPEGRFDLAAAPDINTWLGRRTIQLKILDWRPSE
jgi:single-stranded-DNA-specific exonuclease